jgi:hypothetical protein
MLVQKPTLASPFFFYLGGGLDIIMLQKMIRGLQFASNLSPKSLTGNLGDMRASLYPWAFPFGPDMHLKISLLRRGVQNRQILNQTVESQLFISL